MPQYVPFRNRMPFAKTEDGFHTIVGYADVVEASRKPQLFGSGPNAASVYDIPAWLARYVDSMINMDGPRHSRIRRVVARAFSPRMLAGIDADLRSRAARIVDVVIRDGAGDFVTQVAQRLPVEVICDLLGLSEQHHELVVRHSNTTVVRRVGRQRIREPRDDLISTLVHSDVDVDRLTPREVGTLSARNPAGRLRRADRRSRRGGRPARRPVIAFRRTVTRGCELGGHPFTAGDKLMLFYNSANRDETVFRDPDSFDITRSPNPHLGFGGPGPHFCLGAHLARLEVTVMLRELFTRLPAIRTLGEPGAPATGPRSARPRVRAPTGCAGDGAHGPDVAGAFLARFREAFGESPYGYLQTRRVERAMALLRRGDLSVTEVCLEVGFTSLGSFGTTFTRLVGMPPGAYRAGDHTALAPIPPCVAKAWTRPSRNGEAPGRK